MDGHLRRAAGGKHKLDKRTQQARAWMVTVFSGEWLDGFCLPLNFVGKLIFPIEAEKY